MHKGICMDKKAVSAIGYISYSCICIRKICRRRVHRTFIIVFSLEANSNESRYCTFDLIAHGNRYIIHELDNHKKCIVKFTIPVLIEQRLENH